MAAITTHQIALRISDPIPLHPEGAGGGHFGKRRPEQVKAMTGFAPGFVLFVKITVIFIYPVAVVHVMEAMRAVGGELEAALGVADRAFDDLAGIPLERLGCHIVIGGIVRDRPLGMGAAVTVFAANTAVPLAEAI